MSIGPVGLREADRRRAVGFGQAIQVCDVETVILHRFYHRRGWCGTAGCDLYIPAASLTKVAVRLVKVIKGQGGCLAGWRATEIARVEAGVPRFGIDMDGNTLPPEAGLEKRAISYTKGCYIGQEIIARIRTYGRVNRSLVGYELDVDLAKTAITGTKLTDDSGKTLGTLTSIVNSPKSGPIALGMAKRGSERKNV